MFSVRVTVSRDAPVRSGAMTLCVYDSKKKIIVQSTARIGVEVRADQCAYRALVEWALEV